MNEPVYHFAVKSISLSTNKLRKSKPCSLLVAARHNLREIQAELGAVGRIYAERIRDNVIMAGPKTAAEVQAKADALRAGAGIGKLRSDHCQAIEVVFSIPPDSTVEAMRYFEQSLQWLAGTMPYPLLSAIVHNDEATKHLHALLLPLEDGVYIGIAPIAKKSVKALSDSFFTRVAGPAGFRRDSAKLRGMVKEMAVSAVLYECEGRGLPDLNGPMWEAFRAYIERDPTHAMQALGLSPADLSEHAKMREQKPIRFDSKPLGLAPDPTKSPNLSCVGFAQEKPLEVTESTAALGGAGKWQSTKQEEGCSRLECAQLAQRKALDRFKSKEIGSAAMVAQPADLGGVVRVRDELAHDTSAWADY